MYDQGIWKNTFTLKAKIWRWEVQEITVYGKIFSLSKEARSFHTFVLPVCYPQKSSMCITIIFFYFVRATASNVYYFLTCKNSISQKIKVWKFKGQIRQTVIIYFLGYKWKFSIDLLSQTFFKDTRKQFSFFKIDVAVHCVEFFRYKECFTFYFILFYNVEYHI